MFHDLPRRGEVVNRPPPLSTRPAQFYDYYPVSFYVKLSLQLINVTWSIALREEHRLTVSENRVFQGKFGPKRE